MNIKENETIRFRNAEQEDLPHLVARLAGDPLGRQREEVRYPLNEQYPQAFNAPRRLSLFNRVGMIKATTVGEGAGELVGDVRLLADIYWLDDDEIKTVHINAKAYVYPLFTVIPLPELITQTVGEFPLLIHSALQSVTRPRKFCN
ncbi:hypothetical protein [Vibrio sp. CAU 1672]|uniref:hypothetical protein n=1 Tax=Vibrio sp. CAU 1672 TaxID=3032594 RepID=UPI0023DBD657|nr:hypothetical protein [Vibrio sp. CAU 1672]MDF2155764.1 hypothetical protein [Vibrio sp. CAU 1672]